MKKFHPSQLSAAHTIHTEMETFRVEAPCMSSHRLALTCQYLASVARGLLDQALSEPDRNACLWALGLIRAIASQSQIYVHGLSRAHTGDWSAIHRAAYARLKADLARKALAPTSVPRVTPKVLRAKYKEESRFPALAGATLLIIGGEENIIFARQSDHHGFHLEWIRCNVRPVQAAAERIRAGHVTGVVFVWDRSDHKTHTLIREACSLSGTPFVYSTTSLSALGRTLQHLNDEAHKASNHEAA